ncbi:MAG TPA: hypothetical protein VIL86_01695 [Tepidisphaeraceae bacterium]|jgi:opacity protein-like surface antigen
MKSVFAICCAAALLGAVPCRADEPAPQVGEIPAPFFAADNKPAAPTLFSRGTHTFEATGGYIFRDNRHLYYGTIGLSTYPIDHLGVVLQGVGYYGAQTGENAQMIGLTAIARYHFLTVDRLSLFGEVGAGILEGNRGFPPKGTRLNGTYQGGVGLTFQLTDNMHLFGRASFLHISNAFIEGRDRNPAFNGFGGYVGMMWTF